MSYKFKYGDKELKVPTMSEVPVVKDLLVGDNWWNTGSGQNVNNDMNTMHFAYSNHNSPTSGMIVTFGGRHRSYPLQITSAYNSYGFWYRNRDDDGPGWKNWKRLANSDDAMMPINHSHGYATWLGAQYASGGDWLGWYSAYNGSRRGYIQHTGSSFNIVSESGGIQLNTSTTIGGDLQTNRYNCNVTNELIFNSSDSGLYFNWRPGKTSINFFKFCNSNQSGGAVYASSFNNYSDRKLKDNINDIDKAKEFIMSLRPVEYVLKKGESQQQRKHMGFIAQEVSESIKQLGINNLSIVSANVKKITTDEDGNDHIKETYFDEKVDDSQLEWSLNYVEFIAPIVVTIQDQQQEIEYLKNEITELKKLIINLK